MAEFRLSNFTSGAALTAAELNTGLTYVDYTPTWSQTVDISKTVNYARYTKFGKMVCGSLRMTATSAGTSGTKIVVGLPVSASTNNFILGSAIGVNESATPDQILTMVPVLESSTSMSFLSIGTAFSSGIRIDTRISGSGQVVFDVESGDTIYVQFMYEAA